MPVSFAQKVEALRVDFRSAAQLADLLGVSRSQVTRWLKGAGIDPLNAEKVDLLELVWSSLLRLYERDAALAWLFGVNPLLGDRRPVDLIRLGRAEEAREMLALHRRYRQAQRDLENLRSTIAARPNDPRVRLTLADYYLAARDFGRAAGEYERALSLGARTLPPATRRAARERLARAYERLARREDASEQRALVSAP